MGISKKDVAYAAQLAKLRFSEKELEGFTSQLDRILQHVAKLNELNTDGVKPMAHVLEVHNVWRPDEVTSPATDPMHLKNAPATKDRMFRVPKVIE